MKNLSVVFPRIIAVHLLGFYLFRVSAHSHLHQVGVMDDFGTICYSHPDQLSITSAN